jgi:hypothetical protein
MSDNTTIVAGNAATAPVGQSRSSAAFNGTVYWAWNFFGGLAILFALWWLAIYVTTLNPAMSHFASFGPGPAFQGTRASLEQRPDPERPCKPAVLAWVPAWALPSRSACRSAS